MTELERQIIELFRQLDAEQKRQFTDLVQELSSKTQPEPPAEQE